MQTSFWFERIDEGNGVVDEELDRSHSANPRAGELERRIEELEALDDAAFGHFTGWDWTLCTVSGLGLPLLAIWWFAA